jgi:hypothetical protein
LPNNDNQKPDKNKQNVQEISGFGRFFVIQGRRLQPSSRAHREDFSPGSVSPKPCC